MQAQYPYAILFSMFYFRSSDTDSQVMKLLCFLKKTLNTKQTKDVDLFKLFSLLRQFYYVAFFNGRLET